MPIDVARPSADALLAESQRHERGRLKIFLGAAPGVGKTYEMLSQARRKQAEGMDVVVGIVETHGRKETESLVSGLPHVERLSLPYRGRTLAEFDLDAALKRHPQLILVDELAHTNVPGARHAKRHQDVQELLDAGIDVYTTLNVQHLESYNDLVMRITGVEVRETVPDLMLDLATDVELIDLPPDDLIERLHQGKVYVPEQARRALENFFSRGNLLALRELALRAASARVDEELSTFMRAHGIAGPWPTRGRLLVCIDATEASEDLLRSAKRLAEQRHLPWVALYVQTLGAHSTSGMQQQLEANLALAAELGAESASITAEGVGRGVLEYARTCNAAQIVVGRPHSLSWQRWWRGSLATWLFKHATEFEITVVGVEQTATLPGKRASRPRRSSGVSDRMAAWGIGASAAAALLSALLDHWLDLDDLSAVFILGVAIAGAFGGLGAALLACGLSFLAYNFFFTEPLYTFTISDPDNVRALVVFLIVGSAVGLLSGRLQRQEADARRNTLRTATLFDFMRRLATAINERDLREAAASGIAEILGMRCMILPASGDQRVRVSPDLERNEGWRDTETAAANWALEHHEMAGAGTSTLPAAIWCFVPLIAAERAVAVIALQLSSNALNAEERRLLHTLQALLTTAWERFELLRTAADARVQHSAENLRAALLASVSHDLRTPLVSVIGALSAIRELGERLNATDQARLVDTALHEAQRLDRLVQNLLDATRLAQGALSLQLHAVDPSEVVHSAVQGLTQAVQSRVEVQLPTGLPPVRADRGLLEQTLINLLENALKYSPEHSPVLVSAQEHSGWVQFQVADSGPGIEAAERTRIFGFFYRAAQGDNRVTGTGLGLAICKGFVEAMGGRISVQPRATEHGTVFTIELPIDEGATLHVEDKEITS